ncbi:uncharacterized protein LOC108670626 [Hyalella azteca]|uniref:Uncharacterized protein LOC108670626 n=1 Tax=Hyalella azteca TaxID=294128 RepID=A0A8B7NIX0_HYAAZ|nr:uncharacterized protein LOC108670626 [Hyalella azteca]
MLVEICKGQNTDHRIHDDKSTRTVKNFAGNVDDTRTCQPCDERLGLSSSFLPVKIIVENKVVLNNLTAVASEFTENVLVNKEYSSIGHSVREEDEEYYNWCAPRKTYGRNMVMFSRIPSTITVTFCSKMARLSLATLVIVTTLLHVLPRALPVSPSVQLLEVPASVPPLLSWVSVMLSLLIPLPSHRSLSALPTTTLPQASLTFLATLPLASPALIPDFIEWGYCSDVQLQDDFDSAKYAGWWWDISRVPSSYEGVVQCTHQNITLKDGAMVVVKEGLTADGLPANKSAIVSVDTSVPHPHPAHLVVDAEGVPSAPYKVLATDYAHYSCVYSCLQFPGVFAEFFWIFARQPTLAEKYRQLCLDHFRSTGIDTSKLVAVLQGEVCPYSGRLETMQRTNHLILQHAMEAPQVGRQLESRSSVSAAGAAADSDNSGTGLQCSYTGHLSAAVVLVLALHTYKTSYDLS